MLRAIRFIYWPGTIFHGRVGLKVSSIAPFLSVRLTFWIGRLARMFRKATVPAWNVEVHARSTADTIKQATCNVRSRLMCKNTITIVTILRRKCMCMKVSYAMLLTQGRETINSETRITPPWEGMNQPILSSRTVTGNSPRIHGERCGHEDRTSCLDSGG